VQHLTNPISSFCDYNNVPNFRPIGDFYFRSTFNPLVVHQTFLNLLYSFSYSYFDAHALQQIHDQDA